MMKYSFSVETLGQEIKYPNAKSTQNYEYSLWTFPTALFIGFFRIYQWETQNQLWSTRNGRNISSNHIHHFIWRNFPIFCFQIILWPFPPQLYILYPFNENSKNHKFKKEIWIIRMGKNDIHRIEFKMWPKRRAFIWPLFRFYSPLDSYLLGIIYFRRLKKKVFLVSQFGT